ncbi:MAG: PepSY domain-containing protein [Solibacillus sp.]
MNKWLAVPAIIVITLIIWTATTQITRETILNETQASSRVETFYNGDVQHTIKKGVHYFILFETAHGIYEVAVDEENGRFSQLHLIQSLTPTQEEPAPSEAAPRVTTEQARTIAKQAYNGDVEEIVFHESTDGGYYLVEIDTENADLILQIHAITGKVLSVSFEE